MSVPKCVLLVDPTLAGGDLLVRSYLQWSMGLPHPPGRWQTWTLQDLSGYN